MKVLYAVQATGNGHLSRSIEFYPALSQYAEVDVVLSGIQGDLQLPYEVSRRFHGLSFIFGKRGGIDYWQTVKNLKPFRLIRDILSINVRDYDLVISDFEPISAWACRLRGVECVGLSHQAAFLTDRAPRPAQRSRLVEWLYRYFAPTSRAIGLHYESYDEHIMTPVVRSEIRDLEVDYSENDIQVYLPAYGHEALLDVFRPFTDFRWHIFSKHATSYHEEGHMRVYPVGVPEWKDILRVSSRAIIGGGFEGPSEMLYLGKCIMVVPMSDQYEQHCNAAALDQMGVAIVDDVLDDSFPVALDEWLKSGKPINVDFPRQTDLIARRVLGLN